MKTVFLVDDDVTNLMVGKTAISEHYKVSTFSSGERLLKMLEKSIPDLILLDVGMPIIDGYDTIKAIKSKIETKHIPVIFLTAKDDADGELEGLELGAVDYITKPFSSPLLLKRVGMHLELAEYSNRLQNMVETKTKSIVDLQNAILRTMAELAEYRDDVIGGHIERTTSYLSALLNAVIELGLYESEIKSWDLNLVLRSAQLHDVGKLALKDSILQKPGSLSDEEFEEFKKHTVFGEGVIEKIKKKTPEQVFLQHAGIFAGTHHEKWDGSGYPRGLKGKEIPLQGRLMAIADAYDVLVSGRSYKKAFTHEEATSFISNGKGTHFEPELVDAFLKISDEFNEIKKAFKHEET